MNRPEGAREECEREELMGWREGWEEWDEERDGRPL